MKKTFVIFAFLLLMALSGIVQATPPLTVENCTGKMYLVRITSVLSSSYKEEENWAQLTRANSKMLWIHTDMGGYSTTVFPRDVLCIPDGRLVSDFIDNGTYEPSLVLTTSGIAPPVTKTEHQDPPWILFWVFVTLGSVLGVGIIGFVTRQYWIPILTGSEDAMIETAPNFAIDEPDDVSGSSEVEPDTDDWFGFGQVLEEATSGNTVTRDTIERNTSRYGRRRPRRGGHNIS